MSECARFKGRLFDLCTGQASGGRMPVTLDVANAFRTSKGLDPLDSPIRHEKVGTILKRLFEHLGMRPSSKCNCEALAREMDALGVDGCRRERDRLIGAIKANAHELSWSDLARSSWKAVFSGIAFHVNPHDPIASLFDMAISIAGNEKVHIRASVKKRCCS